MKRLIGLSILSSVLLLAPPAIAVARNGAHRSVTRKIVARPVTFQVRNTNTSALPCPSDGASYEIRGHLVAPRSALSAKAARAVTLYLHGFGYGEWLWNFKGVPGYNYATAQARAGHASVVIDRLGYDSSGHPDGRQSCLGAQADIAHQIIGALRTGGYVVQAGAPTAFGKVALAGHSAAVLIADVEAYSFKDIDALIVMSYAYQTTQRALSEFGKTRVKCDTGGEPSEPGGAGGYAYFAQTVGNFKAAMFHSARRSVIEAATALRNRDPCGDSASVIAAILRDQASLGQVKVPVLVVCGRSDALFPASACDNLKRRYTGSRDVSAAFLANTGHALTLERTAPTFRKKMSAWLRKRGF